MPKLRKRQVLWGLAGGAAVLALSGAGAVAYEEFSEDEVCCGIPTPLSGVPRGPEGEIDVASQSVETKVLVGHDFSLHVRPGGDAAEWEVAEAGESGKVLQAKGQKVVKGTHYFTFRALKTGKARVVLRETDGDRTMTYPVEVKDSIRHDAVTRDPDGDSDTYETMQSRMLDGDFAGRVTVRPGQEFLVANRYANQPGYAWKVIEEPDDKVAWLETDKPHITGDPAAERQDWYSFTAREKGTTTVKLFGCYRCGYDDSPTSPESKKFSVTKTLTVVVR
ncbi:hypothetical protein [Streptomyces albidochromogenes]|uniref:Uncharacterized protein n=1 Tax=Streptomyces albidochromogenes TaxID=329524 RepID=A0ABW6FGV9_9ACTN